MRACFPPITQSIWNLIFSGAAWPAEARPERLSARATPRATVHAMRAHIRFMSLLSLSCRWLVHGFLEDEYSLMDPGEPYRTAGDEPRPYTTRGSDVGTGFMPVRAETQAPFLAACSPEVPHQPVRHVGDGLDAIVIHEVLRPPLGLRPDPQLLGFVGIGVGLAGGLHGYQEVLLPVCDKQRAGGLVQHPLQG